MYQEKWLLDYILMTLWSYWNDANTYWFKYLNNKLPLDQMWHTLFLIGGELEVFNAVRRWSTRECKRQRLELTSENRRRVLEGAQYLVRYFIIPKEDFKAGPYKSGLLSSEEAEAVLTNLG